MTTRAFVLAAGLGTRLGALTKQLPKPLVPVGDRPAIAHVVDAIRAGGIGDITANVFHGRDALVAWLGAAGVRASVEDELLGTAGGLLQATHGREAGAVLVYNADVFAPSLDVGALLREHGRGGHDATLVVRRASPGTVGNVGIGREGRVVRLRTTRVSEDPEIVAGEFLGVHVLEPAFTLPRRGCVVGDVYLASPGRALHAFLHDEPTWDVGTPASYLDANLGWLARTASRVFLGAGASVVGAADLVVAGAGARARGRLERVVLWPGASFDGDLRDAIVTPSGVVAA